MEVVDNPGPNGFLCHRCHQVLTFEADRNSGGHEQSTRLNDQFKFISELLPKIDAVHIPECDFDRALAKARPVVRDATHQRAATIPVDINTSRPMAVKGLANTGPQSIAINISASDGPSEAEKEAERTLKAKIARQNALPSWMSNSTVTGESFSAVPDASTAAAAKDEAGQDGISKETDNSTNAQIDDIFEKLKAEQAALRTSERITKADDEDAESEEEDGEENEFEDVVAAASTSGSGKPGSSRDESGDASYDRAPKRVRLAGETEVGNPDERRNDDDDDDDDEELEFEDVQA
ncbi:hypothetical protein CDD80_6594 [Ophiocordyceps camponoti-rufipedis]|uniref:Uncharacterized protein n=1 Tax=Ophiocordyceps camponoti-rufipedis TaxID=2004952 RepID=A0A2C5ZFG4_9HYPO|nr:hypothetical protein CDD80_6594 [Ophiocordyceps camponoti-rufipedis]